MFDLLKLQQLLPREMPPEYRRQQEVVECYLRRMGRGFSADFLEDFWTEVGRLMALESDHAFLSGLRLGVDLSRALDPAPPKSPRP
ncbi:hypothetical protein [Pseudoflavonifractor phocaeensis]|uniref:hypothetical protein n=1 Tax=Pseudoflavonifractor phocaeensis TaxID=1870988 RepID=UPI00195A2481|nr:hypothetical protein [Pseudoflavonifractor phocaeensis]MBM6924474.1 hypothetical protein [Pseudoflavonifractor phocaeensis]